MAAPKYKHMSPYECLLWDEYLYRFQDFYDRFEYDVHVGEGSTLPGVTTPEFLAAGKLLTQKRIDAVGYRPGEIWIYEVKPDAGLSALGQLLAYRDLYTRQFLPGESIHLALVTDHLSPDDEFLLNKNNIAINRFPEVATRWAREHA